VRKKRGKLFGEKLIHGKLSFCLIVMSCFVLFYLVMTSFFGILASDGTNAK
jgi:hypothetical protein